MTRLEQYEQRSDPWMSGLAAFFLVLYATPVIWPHLPAAVLETIRTITGLVWLVFVVDLVARLHLAERKLSFVLHNPIDVVSVAVPMLRPLRVLRVFAAGQALFTRTGGLLRSGQAVLGAGALLVFIGAVAELDAERGYPDASIVTFGDALWWSMTTVTTVGYGDLYPVTSTGRAVAAALMIVGISLIGLVTATVASWFAARFDALADEAQKNAQAETTEALEALTRRVEELTAKLDELAPPRSGGIA